ncbi:MAG: nucleoside monophosphate kinase [Candidatus Sungbacteria bacterium]|uniref:Nucleoside monophosphate kinase n=1 Tax=Candidatus Sungiibacteriota bacterium TaxID=2750080 RepID=A0A933DSW5_9BACT|nr:nucleoside monophosphate kinase [Candidatus Sungbacteria bacterium]
MPAFDFPVFNTRIAGANGEFRLEDPVDRRRYFAAKAGLEIERLKDHLRENVFVAFLLGPKNSGKGTYTKLFMEAVGNERVAHISVGDIVRSVHSDLADEAKRDELLAFLGERYRGFIPVAQAIDIILGRDTKTLLPTEVILALVEREIGRIGRKAIFIDGFPRNLDQVSYSLFFRTLMGYRDDPDFFVFIDVPDTVIGERMKGRVSCPACQTPRGLKLLRTKDVGYDSATGEFFLICDNPSCPNPQRMVAKEGDELGIEALRERIELDKTVMRRLLLLQGVPKVLLRNTVPVAAAAAMVDQYEITPAYRYEWDAAAEKVRVIEEPWVVNDDSGVPSYSLLPAAVTVGMIKQTAAVLGLS